MKFKKKIIYYTNPEKKIMSISDNHTLCIQARGTVQSHLENAIVEWMSNFPSCIYHVSLATNHFNEFVGFGYLWVNDPKVYHVLLGKKHDGSENVEYISDPSFVKKGNQEQEQRWADDADNNVAPLIPVQLPPIVTLNKRIDDINVSIIPALIQEEDVTNALIVRRLPHWVTEKMLCKITSMYSSDKRYPKINIFREKQEARLYFPNHTTDANFACFMLFKSIIKNDFGIEHSISFRLLNKQQ